MPESNVVSHDLMVLVGGPRNGKVFYITKTEDVRTHLFVPIISSDPHWNQVYQASVAKYAKAVTKHMSDVTVHLYEFDEMV